jgi:hypothetical protein
MKLKLLLSIILVFSLSACFGGYNEDYRLYPKTIKEYPLYYLEQDEKAMCDADQEPILLFTKDGNSYYYEGIETGINCHSELMLDTGRFLISINDALNDDDLEIEVDDILDVAWTFHLDIEQTPDYTFGGTDYIEYFHSIGDYEMYVIDYSDLVCSTNNTVHLYDTTTRTYDTIGVETGDGCYSNYYIYVESEDEDEDGEIFLISEAIDEGYINYTDILNAHFEETPYQVYTLGPIFTDIVKLYYDDFGHDYDSFHKYILSSDEITDVLGELSTLRFYEVSEMTESYNTKGVIEITDIYGDTTIIKLYAYGIYIESMDLYAPYPFTSFIHELLEETK